MMKQKTLQTQYNLIKEGKGSKEIFLKEAKRIFPNYIPNAATFNQAENILKQKSIISENVWGVATGKTEQPNWFKIFNENMNESKGDDEIASLEKEASKYSENDIRYKELQKKIYDLKFEKDYALPGSKAAEKFSESLNEAKAVEKKVSKEVTDLEEKNFDYKDKKNIDNVYGEQFLKGYYCEMKNPKNEKKTVDEIKEIVAKNLAKDRLHYVKAGQFGEEGVGYTDELPGLKASKSDQMEKVKLQESKKAKKVDLASLSVGNTYKDSKGSPVKIIDISGNGDRWKVTYKDDLGKEKTITTNLDKGINLYEQFLNEAKKSNQTIWSKLSDEEKESALLSAINDPDDIKDEYFEMDFNELPPVVQSNIHLKSITEAKKSKKDTIESKLAEIDKASNVVALEAKINAIAEMIESKSQRLEMVNEDSDLAELVDKGRVKAIQKEIKDLEKRKAKMEKLYEKSCGKKYQQQEIVDETKTQDVKEWGIDYDEEELSTLSPEEKEKYYQERAKEDAEQEAWDERMADRMMEEKKNDWPEVVDSRYGEYKFELEKVMSDRAKYKVIDVETGKEEIGGRVYGTPSQLQAAADDLIKPSGGRQSSQF